MNRFFIIVISLLILFGCSEQHKISEMNVYFSSERSFSILQESFYVTSEEAFGLIRSVDTELALISQNDPMLKSASTFHDTPTMILEDYYVFSIYSKTELAFTGYYVNGYTGEVQFRTSDYINSLFNSQNKMPNPFFSSIEILKEGKLEKSDDDGDNDNDDN